MYEREEIKLRNAWKKLEESFNQVAMQEEGGGVISQEDMVAKILPIIEKQGTDYAKFAEVYARPAQNGEEIATTLDGKQETKNKANEGDVIVANIRNGQKAEEWIVKGAKFPKLYAAMDGGELPEELAAKGWKRYKAQGKVRGIQVSEELVKQLGVEGNFKFKASWGEDMICNIGDFLVCPKGGKEIYRIEKKAMADTYKPEGDMKEGLGDVARKMGQGLKKVGQAIGLSDSDIIALAKKIFPKIGSESEGHVGGMEGGMVTTTTYDMGKLANLIKKDKQEVMRAISNAHDSVSPDWARNNDGSVSKEIKGDLYIAQDIASIRILAKALKTLNVDPKAMSGDESQQQEQPPKPDNAGAKADIMESIDRSLKLLKRLQK